MTATQHHLPVLIIQSSPAEETWKIIYFDNNSKFASIEQTRNVLKIEETTWTNPKLARLILPFLQRYADTGHILMLFHRDKTQTFYIDSEGKGMHSSEVEDEEWAHV